MISADYSRYKIQDIKISGYKFHLKNLTTMIILFVFYLHTVACIYSFTKRWQEAHAGWGLLAVGLIVLIFFVGWTMSDSLLKFFVEKKGFGILFDRDAMALTLLTVAEVLFLYFQTIWRMKHKKHIA